MFLKMMVATVGLSAAVGGCSPAGGTLPTVAKVHGVITYGGKPVTKGLVSFVATEGKEASGGQVATGTIEADGAFDLTTFNTGDGAVLGTHKVIVVVPEEPTGPNAGDPAKGVMPIFAGPNAVAMPKPSIPKKYGKVEDTPLTQTVVAGTNDFKIELKD